MSTPSKSDATSSGIAKPSAVQVQLDRLTMKNERLTAKLKIATRERDFLKKAMVNIKNDYEARVSNTLKLDIQDVLKCDAKELAELTKGKSVEDLEAMLSHVMLVSTDKAKGTYKPIRVDATGPKYGEDTGLTVPNIFGKTPTQVREMMAGEK